MKQKVYMPQKNDDMAEILETGGAILGAYYGAGAGEAAAGAGVGEVAAAPIYSFGEAAGSSTLASQVGGGLAGGAQGMGIGGAASKFLGENPKQVSPVEVQGNAMSRRMQQIKPPQMAVEEGLASLQNMPKSLRDEYEPVLLQARQKYRGVA